MIFGFIQTQDAPTYPDGSIRLVGGKTAADGNVEIFYKGRWGSICDDEWDIREAYIVCKMLGYNRAVRATFNSQFGRGRGRCCFPPSLIHKSHFFSLKHSVESIVKRYFQLK